MENLILNAGKRKLKNKKNDSLLSYREF